MMSLIIKIIENFKLSLFGLTSEVTREDKIRHEYIKDSLWVGNFNSRQNEKEYIEMARAGFKKGRDRESKFCIGNVF